MLPTAERSRYWALLYRLRERRALSWVVIPFGYVIVALALGVAVPNIEERHHTFLSLDLSAESSRAILSAAAGGMIAFSGVVVSVAVLVVQFGAAQYTPRLVLQFRRDLVVKHALGAFIAPAVYALVALVHVSDTNDDYAANATVFVCFILLTLAILAFFLLIARLLDLLRPRRLYRVLARSASHAIGQVYPDPHTAEAAPADDLAEVTARVRPRHSVGTLTALDRYRLIEVAARHDAVVEVLVPVGAFVHGGTDLFAVHGGPIPEEDLHRAAIFAEERTITLDPAFAVRAIVDVAIRALSPAVNDPTTAVQGLDALEVLLLRLADRRLGRAVITDDTGTVRLLQAAAGWDDLLELALTEIRHYGAGAAQVTRRMMLLLERIDTLAPHRSEAVAEQRGLLQRAVEAAVPDPDERALALTPDCMGLGGPAA